MLEVHASMANGIVKWFNTKKGYGFITSGEAERDVFVHYSSITMNGEDTFKSLNEGDEVSFTIVNGKKGLEAKNVIVIKNAMIGRGIAHKAR